VFILTVLIVVILLVAALSTLLIVLGPLAVARFVRRPAPSELPVWPKVSVFKPVKGIDPAAREGFVSFIEQDYPGELEIIFAVEGYEDPVLPIVHELIASYPDHDIKLVHSSYNSALMGKANNVLSAQAAATGQVYVSADSDVIAPKDALRQMVKWLLAGAANPGKRIGAVGAIPVYREMQDLGAGLMGAYYSPFMLMYYAAKDWLGVRDVFPGTFYAALPEAFAKAGGFARVADNIADDSTMGQYLHELNFESIMSPVLASVPEPTKSLSDLWNHQHRWNLTYRATLPPLLYYLEALLHPFALVLLLPVLFVMAAWPIATAWNIIVLYCLLRYIVLAWLNYSVFKEPSLWRMLWLMPISELVLTGAWLRAIVDPIAYWRGVPHRVAPGGKLVRLETSE
jgi:ceramide glucosyltransferase